MKAKTLLLAAAALAAGAMYSQAQSGVYSQNIVGYVNVPLVVGNNFVANQLDADGTGTNNNVNTVFPNGLPNKTILSCWNGSSFVSAEYLTSSGWSGTNSPYVTAALQPGSGFFISSKTVTNITLVGNVIVGTNSYPVLAGTQVVAPSAPVAGTLDTTNRYVPNNKDIVDVWNPASSTFTSYEYLTSTGWSPSDPQLSVGQAVFLDAKKAGTWTEILNVQ